MASLAPPTDRDLAEFAAAALHFGLLSPEAVVAWADSVILAESPPPTWAVDLSLSALNSAQSMGKLLAAVPGSTTGETSLELLLGLLYREWHRGHIDRRRIQGIAAALADPWNEYVPKAFAGARPSVAPEWPKLMNDEAVIPYGCDDALAARAVNDQLAPFSAYSTRLPVWA